MFFKQEHPLIWYLKVLLSDLTHISLASYFSDIGKQYSPR